MKSIYTRWFATLTLTFGAFQQGLAQDSAATHRAKPILMVMGFEGGTVSAQARDKGFMRGSRNSENYEPSQLGIGIADMLIEKLLETGAFRLVERKPTDAGSGAQFIVTGSPTRVGFVAKKV